MRILVYLSCMSVLFYSCNQDNSAKKTNVIIPSAEASMRRLIKSHPDSLLLKENLIQFYRENGDYSNAIKLTDSVINRDSLNAHLWDIKAILYFEDGDTVHSILSLEKAISIFPDNPYLFSLGTLYAQTQNHRAIDIADELTRVNKTETKEAMFIKGLYYSFTNDKIKAITFFDKCLALNYTFMDAYREKAIALYDLGKFQEALLVLDKAITLQNNFDEGYYYSGRCLEKLGRNSEAIQSYRNALLYNPDYIEAKEALANLGIK